VIQIIRLYMEAEKAFGAQQPSTEADEAAVADIVEEIDALADDDELGAGEIDPEEDEDERD
jgi:hypothetical protein